MMGMNGGNGADAGQRTTRITGQWLAAAVSAALLVGCGGGGGGGKASSSAPRSINADNEKHVVALVMRSVVNSSGESSGGGSASSSAAALRATRERVEQTGYCSTGSFFVDADTGEEIFEDCVLAMSGGRLLMDGTIRSEDLRDDPDAAFDERTTYDAFSQTIHLSDTDYITDVLDGSVTDIYGDTTDRAEADLGFQTSYVCQGHSGGYAGDYRLTTVVETEGEDEVYTENGQLTLSGHPSFTGTLAITTQEAMRYRDGYNDHHPYAGIVQLAAADGSEVTLRMTEGGLFVNETFYTWAQFDEQFVVDDALAPCLNQ